MGLNRVDSLRENKSSRLSIWGGMSASGGVHVDLTYSLGSCCEVSFSGHPAKKVLRCISRCSREMAAVMSDVVSLGVRMNLNSRPNTRQISWGAIWCLVRSWKVRLGICKRGLDEAVDV